MQAKPFPLSFRSRWLLLVPVVLLAHGALWWLAARQLQAGAAGWVAARQAEGWQLRHGTPARGGWPWAARVTLPAVRLVGADGLGWQAERLVLDIALTSPLHLRLRAEGEQAVLAGPERWPLSGHWQARVALSGAESAIRGEALALALPGGALALRAGSLRWEREASGAALLDLALDGLALPVTTSLGAEVERLAVEAAFAPAPAGLDRGAAEAWQRAGGQVAVPGFELRLGPVAASGTARLMLDSALQPSGQASLRLAGLGEALEALSAAGLVPPRSLAGLRIGLALLQRPDPNGGPPRVDLPLTLAGRRLTAAGFGLGTLPALDWPAE